MNKYEHLKASKAFLLRLVKSREQMERMHVNRKMTDTMVQTMKEIRYYRNSIDTFDRMMTYLNRHEIQVKIRELIPSNKPTWETDFDELLTIGNLFITKNSHLFNNPKARSSQLEAQR